MTWRGGEAGSHEGTAATLCPSCVHANKLVPRLPAQPSHNSSLAAVSILCLAALGTTVLPFALVAVVVVIIVVISTSNLWLVDADGIVPGLAGQDAVALRIVKQHQLLWLELQSRPQVLQMHRLANLPRVHVLVLGVERLDLFVWKVFCALAIKSEVEVLAHEGAPREQRLLLFVCKCRNAKLHVRRSCADPIEHLAKKLWVGNVCSDFVVVQLGELENHAPRVLDRDGLVKVKHQRLDVGLLGPKFA